MTDTQRTKWGTPELGQTTPDQPEHGRAYKYWKRQAHIKQWIIDQQTQTIADLTASCVSLEDDVARLERDYDAIETELKALQAKRKRGMGMIL